MQKGHIFLCHAAEDKVAVTEVHTRLKKAGLSPWLDKEDLRAGQVWAEEIQKVIKSSLAVLIFFSKTSIAKRGYVQKEMKLALDTLDEVPEGQTFIIPVRLDDCDVPSKFTKFHYCDLFAEGGIEQLVKTIVLEAEQRGFALPSGPHPGPSGLTIYTQKTEYVTFLVINPERADLPEKIPDYSFINTAGGLAMVPLELSEIGLNPADYENRFPPHIPQGEMTIDFTITNEGKTAIVSKIALEIMDVFEIPEKCLASGFFPVLEPIEDSAILTRQQKTYNLFRNKTFSYKKGDVDLFRVNVLIADCELPSVFQFRFRVDYNAASQSRTEYSDIFYLAKHKAGPTSRIPYAKRESSLSGTETHGHSNSDANLIKQDFYTDGYYHKSVLAHIVESSVPRDCSLYIKENYWTAVMGDERTPVQVNGFEKPKPEDQPRMHVPGGLHTTWAVFKPSHPRGYRTTGYPDVEIYEGRETKSYKSLLVACNELSQHGSIEEQQEISSFLTDKVNPSVIDVAGVVDTIPLLSFFRNNQSYACLLHLINSGHQLIDKHACDVFTSVRYQKSAGPLLQNVKRARSYSSASALAALAINGNEETAKELVSLFEAGHFHSTEVETIAHVLVGISVASAETIMRDYSISNSVEERRLSYELLKEIRRTRVS